MPQETPAVEAVTPEPVTEAAPVVEAAVEQPAAETPEVPAEAPAPETAPATEAVATPEAEPITRTVSIPAELADQLATLLAGTPATPTVAPTPEPTDGEAVTRTLADVEAEILTLRADLARATTRIEELESEPAVSQPPVVEKSVEETQEALRSLAPHSRLLLGLQAASEAAQAKK
jgi:ribonuclease E